MSLTITFLVIHVDIMTICTTFCGRITAEQMPDEFYAELGSNIRKRRVAIGMTQSDLAAKAGVKRTSIANMERGAQAILVHQLLNIAKALKVPSASLMPKDDQRPPPDPEVELSDDVQQLLGRLERTIRSTTR